MSVKETNFSDLVDEITQIAKASEVGSYVKEVSVEANDDQEGGEFLRVVVRMTATEKLDASDVEPLARSIKSTVARMDERFASIRFVDAI